VDILSALIAREGTQIRTKSMHIEHEFSDLTTWLEAFRRFAPARKQAGVKQTEVFQPGDDPNYIVVSLCFESADAASSFS
jgi:hypothetical protein